MNAASISTRATPACFTAQGVAQIAAGKAGWFLMSDSINEQRQAFVRPITMPGVVTAETLPEALGMTDAEYRDMQAEINRRCDEIRECERRAWISAQEVWIR